jgi:hypothetical protein
MSPISDFHESTIIEVKVTFSFWRFDCAPEEISEILGLSPDDVLVKGETRALRNAREMVNQWNSWSIDSASDSKDVNVQFRELLSRLLPLRDRIRPEWDPSFGVLWKGNYLYAGSGPFYERDVLEGVAKLGAELYQDIYQIDDAEE